MNDYKEKYYDKCYECSDLVDKLKFITNELIKLKERLIKAIEYIENNRLYEEEWDYDSNDTNATNELLSILRGEE